MEMFRAESLVDLIVKAMKAERHDAVKYKRMMESTNNPEYKKQINFAYEDELKHYNMFSKMYYMLTRRMLNVPLPEKIEEYDNLLDAVKSSIEGENEAVDLYRTIYALLPNRQMRDTVFEIITDEIEHAGRFVYLFSMMK
jgi:rubrerythrin